MCDSHIPVRPPLRKNKINEIIKTTTTSIFTEEFTKTKVQLIIFTTAGSDIMIVIVL